MSEGSFLDSDDEVVQIRKPRKKRTSQLKKRNFKIKDWKQNEIDAMLRFFGSDIKEQSTITLAKCNDCFTKNKCLRKHGRTTSYVRNYINNKKRCKNN